jgi:alpha-tubulin suppressor-like RCC1 family protein
MARRADGTLWAWGTSGYGQLGTGDFLGREAPFQVGTDSDWLETSGGNTHTIGLKTNGTIYSWGSGGDQLGLGDTGIPPYPDRTTPTQIGTDSDWIEVTAGYSHSLGRKTDNTIYSWGDNFYGQLGLGDTGVNRTTPTQVDTSSDWVQAFAGNTYTIALKTNGTIYAWGSNTMGQLGLGDSINRNTPTQIGTDSDWTEIVASDAYSIGRKTNGTIYSWGSNSYGQLGLGDSGGDKKRITPTQIGTDSGWAEISAEHLQSAGAHTQGRKTAGTIWSWGRNNYGQLGFGDTINRLIPCPLGSPAPPTLTATVVSSTQIDLSWIDNSYNEENFIIERSTDGINYAIIVILPVNTTSYSDPPAGEAGTGLTFGVMYYYRIRSYNSFGSSPYAASFSTPTILAPSALNITFVSVFQLDLSWIDNSIDEDGFIIDRKIEANGNYEQIAIVNANITSYSDITTTEFSLNTTYYYRLRSYNTLGESVYSNEGWIIIPGNWLDITAGKYHSLGVKKNGTIWSWGRNSSGQLGQADLINRKTPTQIGIDSDWFSIIAGSEHTIGLKTNPAGGTLWAWGRNDYGQLGIGYTSSYVFTPAQINADSDWLPQGVSGTNLSILAARQHTIACKTGGTLWSWGYNPYGQLGFSDTINRSSPTQIDSASDWTAVTTGDSHTLARKTDSTIWACGLNNSGQLGLGYTNSKENIMIQVGIDSDWSGLSAGYAHSLGIKTSAEGGNGTLWAWGNNYEGQLGLGNSGSGTNKSTPKQIGTNSDWLAIAAEEYHSIALKTNLTIFAWGANSYGQLGLGDTYNRLTPSLMGTDSNWSVITAGGHTQSGSYGYSFGIKNNNTLWAWGYNNYGQLGLGDIINRKTPTLIDE